MVRHYIAALAIAAVVLFAAGSAGTACASSASPSFRLADTPEPGPVGNNWIIADRLAIEPGDKTAPEVGPRRRRWKPTSHVYLAMEVLKEIFSAQDLLGNAKTVGKIPLYRVHYKLPPNVNVFNPSPSDRIIERIGEYALHPDLEDALRLYPDTYLAGVVGPDAYPDIATGQQRIHVEIVSEAYKNVPSDAWLQHLWEALEAEHPGSSPSETERNEYLEKFAFVVGYLTHAAGDMYMHTFMNDIAGGPFAFVGTTNGVRHVVAEGYVGKRTPDLDDLYEELRDLNLEVGSDVYDPQLSTNTFDFIYRNLVDAVPGTDLGDDILVDINPLSEFDFTQQTSFPRVMSTLKHGLVADTTWYRDELDQFDATIAQALVDGNPFLVAEQTARRLAHVGFNEPRIAHARGWIDNIDEGLRAWPEFNHRIMKGLTLSRVGINYDLLTEEADQYYRDHLRSMLGAPDLAVEVLQFIEAYEELLFPQEVRDAIQMWKEDFIQNYLLFWMPITKEEIIAYFKSPEVSFEPIINVPEVVDSDDIAPRLVGLTEYNRDYLYIDDVGFSNPNKRFKTFFFEPAYNTITATKFMLMDPAEVARVQSQLCQNSVDCEPVAENALLGFINTLDGDNEFRDEGGIYADQGGSPPRGVMPFFGCSAYVQLFMQQLGENNPCPIRSSAPTISPRFITSTTPVDVTIVHENPDAEIFYAIVDSDNEPLPANETPMRPYEGSVRLGASLVGSVRPWIIVARVTQPGFLTSDSDSTTITIDAQLPTSTFFPQIISHTNFVNVTIGVPGGSTVFYTLNGDEPTYNSTRYDGSLQLGIGTHRIRATAYRIGFMQSTIAEMTYNVYSADAARAAEPVLKYGSFGGFANAVDVEMSTTSQAATIRYEVAKDGVPNVPTQNSSAYTQPFELGVGNWFIRAITFSNTVPESGMIQVNYQVNDPLGVTNAPVLTPAPGVYNNDVQVAMTATTTPTTSGVRIFYSTDGGDPPTTPVTLGNYSAPITLSSTTTMKAQATRSFFPYSSITTHQYVLEAAAPTITPNGTTATGTVDVALASLTNGAEIRYSLDGTDPDEGATLYSAPIRLTANATLRARAFKAGYEFSEVSSADFLIQPQTAPQFVLNPVDAQASEGGSVQLTVLVSGTPAPAISWTKDGTIVAGATSASYTISDLVVADAGRYVAIASNGVGNPVTSSPAQITVYPTPVAPRIIAQPADLTVPIDSSAVILAEAQGSPTPGFQWQRNGSTLPAQKGSSLIFPKVTLAHAGEYRVIAENEAGADTSRTIVLTVAVSTGVEAVSGSFEDFQLDVNYPNPFSSVTRIPFAIAQTADVNLSLFDLQGRRIAILIDRELAPGSYEADFDATGLAGGLYFVRMTAGSFEKTRKMVLVK